MIRIITSYLLIYFAVSFTIAQSPYAVQSQYRFNHITVDEGLSNNNVRAFCQDSKGFIWIATKNGTNKFDGQSILTYRNISFDTTSISSNSVNSIILDKKGELWFATHAGLDRYNYDLDNFSRFTHKDIHWPIGETFHLVEDRNGKVWIAAESGLYAYDPFTEELKYFSNKKNNPFGIPAGHIFRLLVDKKNQVWVSVLNKGVFVYNQENETFRFFQSNSDNPSSLSGNRIETMYEDTKGNIWLGTFDNGLNCFLPSTGSFKRIIPDPQNIYSTRVRAIFEDNKGNFFIGTRNGLYILDNQTDKFIPYAYEGHNFSSLSQNSITSSFLDSNGTLWIGTFSGGVNYTYLNKKEFIHYKAGKNDNHFLNGSIIYAITADKKGNLWVGGVDGLNHLNKQTNSFKYYTNQPGNPNSISYNDVKALEWDKNDNLWIGTNKGGLNYLEINKGKFTSFTHDPDNPSSISSNKIYGLMRDIDNNLWILTNKNIDNQYSSIDILPDGSNKFIHLNEKAFFGFEQDAIGNVYIGSINGFWFFERKDSTFKFISNNALIGNVNTLTLDSKKRIWIGSDKGLVRYNPEDKTFLSYSRANGFPVSDAFGILEDDNNNLWVSTDLGLVKISNVVADTHQVKFRVYGREDGLQSKQFSYNASYKLESGEFAFGGINGFNTFNPSDIVEDTVPPRVVITDLIIYNTPTPIGREVGDRIILEKSITASNEITLGRKQNVFTLKFAALHYADPDHNTFKYKLEGFDENWQYRKAENNFASYTNLPAGEYVFIVTAANHDGIWNKVPVHLRVVVLPPWWKTLGFKVLVVVAGLLFVSFIILFFVLRERSKMALVVERMKVNKLNELNMLKLKFFTNISHEIRTPLTLIITPLEKLISKKLSKSQIDSYLRIMHRNTKNLNQLVDQLLDFRKLESGNLKLEMKQGDLIRFVSDIIGTYNNYAIEKGIVLKFRTFYKRMMVQYDPDKISKILNNLLSNAFKYTSKNGNIIVSLNLVFDNNDKAFRDENPEGRFIEISVTDTGEGIPERHISKIFNRFYQSDSKDEHSGTGIGLSFVKELVKIHNGKIFVESEQGKGSKFTFRIPYCKEVESANKELEVDEENNSVHILSENDHLQSVDHILLIIDDNPDIRILIRDHFNEKFKVYEANNGKEGWETTLKVVPDVIISDVLMPDINGFDFCKKVKNDERTSHIPLILLTALHSKEQMMKGLASGANDYITKPFDLGILQTKIQNILSIRNSFKEKYSKEIILQPKNVVVSSPDQKFLKKAVEVVEKFISDPEFDLDRFVKEVGVSRMQLYRKLHALTDMTVKEFIRNIRLKRAAQLLVQDGMTISEVAYAVGFKDVSHFGKCFRQTYGINAKEYKNRSQIETP